MDWFVEKFVIRRKKMKVGFVGVGKLGKDAAEVMGEKHHALLQLKQ